MIQTTQFQVGVGDFVLIQIHQESCLELFCGKTFMFLHEGTCYCNFTPHTTPIIHNMYYFYLHLM